VDYLREQLSDPDPAPEVIEDDTGPDGAAVPAGESA
jgi:hypothetical protein